MYKLTLTSIMLTAFCLPVMAAPTIEEAQHLKFPEPLGSVQPLVIEAIRSGEAEGVLGGDAAKFINDKIGADAPLTVKVTRLFKYQQQGCARLNTQFKQDKVKIPGEKDARNREINFQFNYCLDGRPPKTEGQEYVRQNVLNRPFWAPVGQ